MSATDLADLLSPEGAPLNDPGEVERALSTMWRSAGKKATGATEHEAVTRVCLANLIVVGDAAHWGDLIEVLGELSPIYPTRTIVLLLETETGGAADAHRRDAGATPANSAPGTQHSALSTSPAPLRASVSAICHIPQPDRPQVCCEQIVLRTPAQATAHLDRTVLPLIESEVPTAIWWTPDPSAHPGLFERLRKIADRLVLDAGTAGFAHLEPHPKYVMREIGWYRTYRLRELLAGMFDGCDAKTLAGIEEISVELGMGVEDGTATEFAGNNLSEFHDACWLVAFIAGQLGWSIPASGGRRESRNLEKLESEYQLSREGGDVHARITGSADLPQGLHRIHIKSGNSTFDVCRCGRSRDEYRVIICDHHVCQMGRSVYVPPPSRTRALSDALVGRANDPAFDRAARIMQWLRHNT